MKRFFWSRLAKLLRLPETYENLDGWIFDGRRVFTETLCQTHDPRGAWQTYGFEIPKVGSDYWFSPVARMRFHKQEIFDSRREAHDHALAKIDQAVKELRSTRERLVLNWRGHLKPIS